MYFLKEKRLRNGLENGALPFIFAKNAKKRPKKRSIAVHYQRGCVADHRNRLENGALPFTFLLFFMLLYVEANLTYNIRPWQEKQRK